MWGSNPGQFGGNLTFYCETTLSSTLCTGVNNAPSLPASALRPAPQPSSPTKSGDHHNLHKPDVPNVAGASPLNPLNKENEVSTPRRSLLLSKLRYAPSVNSPLLNDITDK